MDREAAARLLAKKSRQDAEAAEQNDLVRRYGGNRAAKRRAAHELRRKKPSRELTHGGRKRAE